MKEGVVERSRRPRHLHHHGTTRDAAIAQLKALRDDIVSGNSNFNDVASATPTAAPPSAAAISVCITFLPPALFLVFDF